MVQTVQLIDVSKHFPAKAANFTAVDNININIDGGKFVSLLGPSGCGKSTTLRMVAGFETPTSGRILLDGVDVTEMPPYRRDVNMVFQNYALFPHLSVHNNVAYGLRRRGVSRGEVRRRVGEALDLVELNGLATRRPGKLSGGQQQRVALARALVNRPRALLLDEPLSALDYKLRQVMQKELKRIQREVNISFLYVTHDQGEALSMSDQIVVMRDGRVIQQGSPEEIYEQPKDAFVASFIGRATIFSGKIARQNGHTKLEANNEVGEIYVRDGSSIPRDGAASVLIRPDKMRIAMVRPSEPGQSCVRCTVVDTIYLGSSIVYVLRTAGGVGVEVVYSNGDPSIRKLGRDEQTWVSWPTEHSHLVDN